MQRPKSFGISFSGTPILMRIERIFTLVSVAQNNSVRFGWKTVELAKKGDLTDAQVKEVITIAEKYQEKLLHQWSLFKEGKPIKMIKVNK